jgi:hypothetical protein
MLAPLESANAKIKLEEQVRMKIANARKHTTKVLKQHEKKLRQIAKSGKQTTKVPKQQKKMLEA